MITGFKDKSHSLDTKAVPANVQNIGKYRVGLDVFSNSVCFYVGSDSPGSNSTNYVLVAPGHICRVGDIVQFTLGNLLNEWAFVQEVTSGTITLSQKLSEAPSITDTFDILRIIPLRASSSGAMSVVASIPSVTDGPPGVFSVGIASGNLFSVLGTLRYMFFKNNSANTISLGFNATAVLGSGVTLARGEVYIHDIPFSGTLSAIASAAASNLSFNSWS